MTLPHFKFYFILSLFLIIFISFQINYFILDLDCADSTENFKMEGVTDNVHEVNIVILFYVDINKVWVI